MLRHPSRLCALPGLCWLGRWLQVIVRSTDTRAVLLPCDELKCDQKISYFADVCQKGRQIFNGATDFFLLRRPSWPET